MRVIHAEFRRAGLSRTGAVVLLAACLYLPAAAAGQNADPNHDPLMLVVSLETQHLSVYRADERVFTSPVSTGRQGYATPTGIFSILQKRRWHRSNIYSQAPMPFMQRLTWSGIALHAGRLPGYPASHGCIRLPDAEAQALFAMTGLGAHVVVQSSQATPPREIAHPVLFQPAPPVEPDADTVARDDGLPETPLLFAEAGEADSNTRTDATAAIGEAGSGSGQRAEPDNAFDEAMRAYRARPGEPLRIYVSRRTGRERVADMQKLLAELGHDPGEIDGLMGPNTSAAIRAFQNSIGRPASGAFSEELVETLYHAAGVAEPAEAHLYVRQGFKPLFEAPVRLRDPDLPLGTHLFTAMHFEDGARKTRWLALSPQQAGTRWAARALDRIALPAALRARISALLTPGSSLLISDQGLGLETGARGTDFIVLTD